MKKTEKLRKILDDPEFKPGEQVEFDLSKVHAVVTLIPLATPAGIYRKQIERAIALAEKTATMIRRREGEEGLDAAEAIRANREERDQERG